MNKESLETEIRCSAACTRSGIAALLVSIFALSLIGPVKQAQLNKAVSQYFSLRYQLKTAIEVLDEAPCWNELKKRYEGLESSPQWNIKKLLEARCPSQGTSIPPGTLPRTTGEKALAEKTVEDLIKAIPPHERKATAPPSAPTLLSVTILVPLPAIKDIVEILKKLNDRDMLKLARSASFMLDHSIYRWEFVQGRLGLNHRKDFTEAVILNNLTMANVRKLATYELPSIASKDFVKESAGSEVSFDPATAKLGLVPATILVEASIVILALYFLLFQREAMLCSSFPASGTLFGAFYRSLVSKIAFVLLAFVPAMAGAYLAWVSLDNTYANGFLAAISTVLSVLVSYMICRHVLVSPLPMNSELPWVQTGDDESN